MTLHGPYIAHIVHFRDLIGMIFMGNTVDNENRKVNCQNNGIQFDRCQVKPQLKISPVTVVASITYTIAISLHARQTAI